MLFSVNNTLSDPLLQVPGIAELGLKPRKIKKVAVVGGGLMGSGIVTALILSGYPVLLKEINDKFLQGGLGRIKGTFCCADACRGSVVRCYVQRCRICKLSSSHMNAEAGSPII